MKITYNKLFRDLIPQIIEKSGKTAICDTLSEEAYLEMLDKKLVEEMNEYQSDKNLEELASYVESNQKVVFFFTADWCPDCQFIYPVMPEIEALHPDMTFVRVNRDDYMALAQTWNIFGIPSFVVTQKGQELGRLVNKARKTKEEINAFLSEI